VLLPGPLNPFPLPDPSCPKPTGYFEDASLLILEKPGLLPCHPLSPFETGTLANALIHYWPQTLGLGSQPLEPGLVHRLDTGTSGLLAVALTPDSWTSLRLDLKERSWKKTYLALVEGNLAKPLTLSLPLAHDPRDRRKMKVLSHPKGSRRGQIYRADTRIRPLTPYPAHTLVEVDLLTGVTHQIRVHLASCGHPVAGDALYGSTAGPELGLEEGRFFLHAHKLSLPHPINRTPLHFQSELPRDLQQGLSRLGPPIK
jgi:23S rRNA pseudouridine1911/1915/1917 synthase